MTTESKPVPPKTPFGVKKITQTPQGRSFAWISLTVFTISFFLLVAIRPTIVTVAKLSREIKEKREAEKQLDKKIDSLVTAQKIYAQNSNKISLLEEAFPQNNNFPTLAYFLEKSAQENQVQISTLSFEKVILSQSDSTKKTKNNNPYLEIGFSVSAQGEYNNLKSFISSLENSRRLITIESSRFSESQKKNEEEIVSTLSLSIYGKAFYEKE